MINNRAQLKSVIKKIVLSEITKADYGVGKPSTCSELVKELDKAVKKAAGEVASVSENPLGNKITFDDGRDGAKFQVELYRKNDNGDRFDLTAFFQGSERFTVKDMTKDSVLEFIKDNLKVSEDCPSYVEKALAKGKAPIDPEFKKYDKNTEKAKEVSAGDDDNEEKEADEKTQKDIADDDDKDAEEDAPEIEDEVAPQLGGELVDKIEKIIDKVLKGKQVKADAKSAYLKADSDKESPDKLVVKAKETPKLKEKKKLSESVDPLGKPDVGTHQAFRVHIPANVYDGKYYVYRTYPLLVLVTDETRTEQDAIRWVNAHKTEVLARIDRAKVQGGRRMVKAPVDKNVFFKDTYYVKKTEIGQLP